MLSTAIVIFREALEIAMILSIVLVATRGLAGRGKWIAAGLGGGVLGAALVAVFAQSISAAMEGMGQEIFNAAILLTAAAFIGWTVVWMRTHARELAVQLRQVGHEVTKGNLPRYTLALIVGLALLREGAEIVMFVYGMILSGQSTFSIVGGSALGVALGTITGVLLYLGLIKLSAKYMLSVTSWLLVLLVSGLSAQAAGFLTQAGYFETLSQTVWDSSWLLSDDSVLGQTLHSLIGYSAQPTLVQLMFYMGTLTLMLALIAFNNGKGKGHAHASEMPAPTHS